MQFQSLSDLSKEIWCWCEERRIWIFASYIKSSDNVDADRESRWSNINTEWELEGSAFMEVTSRLGTPEVDLFATRSNTKCPKYFSWKADPEAINVDAFTVDWKEVGFLRAFPPFSLIAKVLRKIISDKAWGIIVVPNWPSQP